MSAFKQELQVNNIQDKSVDFTHLKFNKLSLHKTQY